MDKKELARELDRLVSLYVRKTENRCFTCGNRLSFKKRQAGHYLSRTIRRTRWDLDNVHVQCNKCNVELGGNLKKYRERLDPEIREKLNRLAELYNKGRLPEPNLTEMKILRDFYRHVLGETPVLK